MSSTDCDYKYDDTNFGYVMLVDKQINIYEQIFAENEQNYNQYNHVEPPITTTNNDHTYHANIDKPKKPEKPANMYASQYKVKLSLKCQLVRTKPTRIRFTSYICKWDKCSFESTKSCHMIKHLLDKHINNRQFRNYRRSFVGLNVYRYKCSHVRCDYETNDLDAISKHVNNGHKNWKCTVSDCGKIFPTKIDLILHEKHHLCGFKLNDEQYLNGNGVCSLANIKTYYKRRKVIDGSERDKLYHRYLCQWSKCWFKTYDNDAIDEHVHNRHTCPHINRVPDKDDGKTVKRKYNTRKKVQI